ncbi:pilus assembly protein [Myxococcus llanfairpwllgwyngyllgogerychwyrndrobwllllantysiliogogogochensis]|uniref:Pilus assembly protein n=1 Tax=Myxococcus llanfairpwllgwyngyllgogerychwyrndrobwllllantysiliogogogochensis TaxID=2590453 RepID=A0A540X281_9BACT|nr:pilus assembly protein [Myxococcus llanfairpwllgwyngyllgogerychwyrndrobwllllantysiliogogogochensis]TQF15320.1 pilus assembly protein [Myxococcus llanfairpwllgwyngyllgogerychwyrndrobwllllantysiliogogogochensis]
MTRRTGGTRPGRRSPRAQRGAATTEFAILAPVLVAMMLWANYFWELQHVRLKAAELARYVAFERTVRPDVTRIASEAQERYQDLDGSTKTGELPSGMGHQNPLTLQVQVHDAEAPLSDESMEERGGLGGAMQIVGKVLGALGATAGRVAKSMGLDPNQGAVRAEVAVHIENGIIPQQIAFFIPSLDDDRLDLRFTETFYMVHDTWRAWGHGDHPSNTYARVQQITHDRVKRIVYAGLASENGALDAIGKVLSVLGLDFPLMSDYIKDSVLIVQVKGRHSNGYFPTPIPRQRGASSSRPTRTVPGDVLQAAYWMSDTKACFGNCEPEKIQQKRGLDSTGSYDDNWPMRSYNCRGKFFQGAAKSEAPESEYSQSSSKGEGYHTYGDDACE